MDSSLASGNGCYYPLTSCPKVWDAELYLSNGTFVITTDEKIDNIYVRSTATSTTSYWTWVTRNGKVAYTDTGIGKEAELYKDKQLTTATGAIVVKIEKLRNNKEELLSFSDIVTEWEEVVPMMSTVHGPIYVTGDINSSTTSPVSSSTVPFMTKLKTNYVANTAGQYEFAIKIQTGAFGMQLGSNTGFIDLINYKGTKPAGNIYTMFKTILQPSMYPMELLYRAIAGPEVAGYTLQVKVPGASSYTVVTDKDCYSGDI